jgi:hypothetical protein
MKWKKRYAKLPGKVKALPAAVKPEFVEQIAAELEAGH